MQKTHDEYQYMSDSDSLPAAATMEGVISALLYMLSCYAHRAGRDLQLEQAIRNHLHILRSSVHVCDLPMLTIGVIYFLFFLS